MTGICLFILGDHHGQGFRWQIFFRCAFNEHKFVHLEKRWQATAKEKQSRCKESSLKVNIHRCQTGVYEAVGAYFSSVRKRSSKKKNTSTGMRLRIIPTVKPRKKTARRLSVNSVMKKKEVSVASFVFCFFFFLSGSLLRKRGGKKYTR